MNASDMVALVLDSYVYYSHEGVLQSPQRAGPELFAFLKLG